MEPVCVPVTPKFRALEFLLGRSTSSSELCPADFEADADGQLSLLRSSLNILVVGAGGLGCEMLKDLALSGFCSISVIDMDTIDVSNLNRQFLFSEKDVGCSKAEAAARAIMRRFGKRQNNNDQYNNNNDTGVTVTAHHARIEDMPASFYRQFQVVVLGLDSLEARAYLNSLLCGFLEYTEIDDDDDDNDIDKSSDHEMDGNTSNNANSMHVDTTATTNNDNDTTNDNDSSTTTTRNNIQLDHSSIIPIVDAGTEGFAGHTRVIYPGITPCIQCTMWLYPPQTTYPLCTLAETPRSPAHCIEYVKLVQWNNERSSETFDADNSEHMQWMYTKALTRAEMFGIHGVTMRLTMGVVKNIIPAIPSTNAIMSAAAVLEVIKICTFFSKGLNNYIMFSGTRGVYMHNVSYERDPNCVACSAGVHITMKAEQTLQMLIEKLKNDYAIFGGKLTNPSVSYQSRNLYMTGILEEQTRDNLSRSLSELLVGSTAPHSSSHGNGNHSIMNKQSGKRVRVLLTINDKALPGPKRCWLTMTYTGANNNNNDTTTTTQMEHE